MRRTSYLVVGLTSAAALAFQITLTRLFSLAQGHHMAFMAISLALLGVGASGTFLSLRRVAAPEFARTLRWGTILFALSIPVAYLTINYLPFDAYRIAWERIQLLWLVIYYLALAVPFFFSGIVVGTSLAAHTERSGAIYAANLLGSGIGPPLALLALANVGGPGTIFFCALCGLLAAVLVSWGTERQKLWMALVVPATAICLWFAIKPPGVFEIRLSPYKSLSQVMRYPGSEVIFSQWNAHSRVDVVQSDGIRSAPGLSFAYRGELPAQLGMMVDGDNLVPISKPIAPDFTGNLPPALAFELKPEADVLILEPGGGLAVQAALNSGAKTVTAVHGNHTAASIVSEQFAGFSGNPYADSRVTLIVDEPRSFLRRTERQFDLILLPLTDAFRPVTAGAYTLNEDYRYTVEAISDALAHLSPDGLLVIERWVQLPPSESLRLWATMARTLRELGIDPIRSMLALRSLQTSLIVASPTPFSAQDLSVVRAFAADRQFDLIWLPGVQVGEVNRFSVVPDASYFQAFEAVVTAPDTGAFLAEYPYNIVPPTDDHPYFFHFFKWRQTPEIVQMMGKTWQPFGGSGYLMLVILLVLALLLSIGLILLPLVFRRIEAPKRAAFGVGQSTWRYLFYFLLLGFGFLFVEIPLLQRFILYLGQPAYAFAAVVSALLVASGAGSGYLSGRVSLRVALPVIVLLVLAYPIILPSLFDLTLSFTFAGRVVIAAVVLLPLGVMLGIPFPRGLVLVGQGSPGLVPWVWGVNGCASVVSAILAAMVSLTWGFSAVLWGAALAYALAGITIWRVEGAATRSG